MAAKTKVRVDGLRELDAALGELTKATAKNVVRRSLVEAGEPMAIDMASRAPVLTGALGLSVSLSFKAPLGVDPGKDAYAKAMKGGATKGEAVSAMRSARRNNPANPPFVDLFVGPGRHPQAITQEFGTKHHPAQPSVRPAWDAGKQGALQRLVAAMTRNVAAAVKRAQAKAARALAKAKAS